MGNDVLDVKWCDWKIHMKGQTGWNGVLRGYTMPRIYNMINDPYKRNNFLFLDTWLLGTGLAQLEEHVASLKKFPPIPSGIYYPYELPN